MNFEEYLQSEQARSTIAKLIEVYPDQTIMNTMAEFHGQWELGDAGAWRRVAIYGSFGPLEPPLATVYYRPDGDRFIVSDLGDGLKALRLRSGDYETMPLDLVQRCGEERNYGWSIGVVGLDKVKSADLPDAICRVMLASYRVANL